MMRKGKGGLSHTSKSILLRRKNMICRSSLQDPWQYRSYQSAILSTHTVRNGRSLESVRTKIIFYTKWRKEIKRPNLNISTLTNSLQWIYEALILSSDQEWLATIVFFLTLAQVDIRQVPFGEYSALPLVLFSTFVDAVKLKTPLSRFIVHVSRRNSVYRCTANDLTLRQHFPRACTSI